MLLSQCKLWNWEFELDYPHCHHFLAIQLFQRKYLGYNFGAVSLSLHICRTSWQDTQNHKSNHVFFYFFPSDLRCFGDELNRYSKTAHADIWAHDNLKQIFGFFKLRFHNELLHWEKNRFLVFFRAGLHLHVRKISTLSFKQYQIANCKLQGYWIKIGWARKGKFSSLL